MRSQKEKESLDVVRFYIYLNKKNTWYSIISITMNKKNKLAKKKHSKKGGKKVGLRNR